MKLKKIVQHQREFVRERDWEQFHTPRNLATALNVEAAELLEIFQWLKDGDDRPQRMNAETFEHLREEMADVFFYLLRLADVTGIDLEKAFWSKMKKNERKYPAALARGSATKYTRLGTGTKRPKKSVSR